MNVSQDMKLKTNLIPISIRNVAIDDSKPQAQL